MITRQFYVNGLVTQSDLTRVFRVTAINVKGSVKKFREEGSRGFYAQRRVRGGEVLLTDVVEKAEELLTEDEDIGRCLTAFQSADTPRKLIDPDEFALKNGAPNGRSHSRMA